MCRGTPSAQWLDNLMKLVKHGRLPAPAARRLGPVHPDERLLCPRTHLGRRNLPWPQGPEVNAEAKTQVRMRLPGGRNPRSLEPAINASCIGQRGKEEFLKKNTFFSIQK